MMKNKMYIFWLLWFFVLILTVGGLIASIVEDDSTIERDIAKIIVYFDDFSERIMGEVEKLQREGR